MAIPKITVTGVVHHVSDLSQITPTFSKREFVLLFEDERNSAYNQYVKFEIKQTKAFLVLPSHKGMTVTLECNLNGKEHLNEKNGVMSYFNCLDVWKVTFEGVAPVQKAAAFVVETNEADDLPF